MITDYKSLKQCLKKERAFYFAGYDSFSRRLFFRFTSQHPYMIWRYVRLIRICEYLLNTSKGNKLKVLLFWLFERRRNHLGHKLGFCITPNVFDDGLYIDHLGSIVINPRAKVGKNCHMRGHCCIGMGGSGKGSPVIGFPVLGDNINIGWGTIIQGEITIADGVLIGANSVVTKSITEPNSVYVGAPAKRIR